MLLAAALARRPTYAVALLGFLAAIAIIATSPARAEAQPPATLEALAHASSSIVVGEVVATQALDHGPRGQPGIHTRVTLRVAETIAGPRAARLDFWVQGGRLGSRLRVVPQQAVFVVGERVVVLLFAAGGGLWPTGMSAGKWTIETRRGRAAIGNTRVIGTRILLEELRAVAERVGARR